jgi:hypothetical protein
MTIYNTETLFRAIRQTITPINRESGLVQHAERELKAIGEEQEVIDGYLKMLTVFADMGHSGASAMFFIDVLNKVIRFENLGPLTNDPDEWMDVGEMSGFPFWQSRRCSEAFSTDGGQTYYLLSDGSHDGNIVKTYESETKA